MTGPKRRRRTHSEIIRLVHRELLVETSVFDGQSSAVILEAMRCNGKGRLLSIDLPALEMIQSATSKMPVLLAILTSPSAGPSVL